MDKLQPLSAKIGEVKFRQKLVKQHLGESQLVPLEPDQKEILKILKQRVISTRKIFEKLKNQGFPLSPFLEIGAEKGQRSMVLVNEFRAEGYAIDLSFQSLASAKEFSKLLSFPHLPAFICGDVYQLPFANDSFPFIFCFETLHHFPNPTPVIKEIERVLAPGGIFFFAEEPIKQTFNLGLWRRGYHLNLFEKFLKIIGLLPFVSKIGKAEVDSGVLEEEFSLKTWKMALEIFKTVKAAVKPVFFGPESSLNKNSSGWQNSQFLSRFLITLEGGGIEGFALKKGKSKESGLKKIVPVCPDCQKIVIKKAKDLFCPSCKRKFSQKQGVWLFLPIKLQKKLYG